MSPNVSSNTKESPFVLCMYNKQFDLDINKDNKGYTLIKKLLKVISCNKTNHSVALEPSGLYDN